MLLLVVVKIEVPTPVHVVMFDEYAKFVLVLMLLTPEATYVDLLSLVIPFP